MATTRKSRRFHSEFSSDDEDLAQTSKMEKAKKKSIMTTVDPGKKHYMVDVSRLSDDELWQKLIDLGYDPGPIVESTRKVYEIKLQDLLTSESTGDKSPNGTSINDSDQYSDSEEEEEVVDNSHIQNSTSSNVHKRIFENNFSSSLSQVTSSEKEITPKYKSPYTTTLQEDFRYPMSNSSSDRFSFTKSDYRSSDLLGSTLNKTYDRPFDRSEFSQLSRSGIHRDYRSSANTFTNSSNKPAKKKSKKLYIIFTVLLILVAITFFVYYNLEPVKSYEDPSLIV